MSEIASNQTAVPRTLKQALDPAWLTSALHVLGRGAIVSVECVEVIRTVATKVRFTVRFAGDETPLHLCLKGLLDVDAMTARGGATCVREADFYGQLADRIAIRVPQCIAHVVDREAMQAVIIMHDLIAEGARFCSALEPFSASDAASSLGQIARLHQASGLLETTPWITRRIDDLAEARYVTVPQLQEMLDGPRGQGLPAEVRDAQRLVTGLRSLAARDAQRPQFLVHGDAHAGNLFVQGGQHGLIDWQLLQRGNWALDVAYHVAAVLPVEVAEREERALLDHYLAEAGALGCAMPDRDAAWRQYRESVLYGFYLWGITRRVDPPIINLFVQRLGSAVARHGSHALLGV